VPLGTSQKSGAMQHSASLILDWLFSSEYRNALKTTVPALGISAKRNSARINMGIRADGVSRKASFPTSSLR
jgi:hypothetical protein